MFRTLSAPIATQMRRFSTTEPSAIVSRRAWLTYRKRNPSRTVNKTQAPKEDEKPWPRNIILTAYAVAAVSIPYSAAWYLSMDQKVRQAVVTIVPSLENILRSHFGHEEYASIQDRIDGVEPIRKLDDEDPNAVRKQQDLIEGLINEEIPLQIYLYRGGDVTSTQATFKGNVLTTSNNLMQQACDGSIAIDFDDLPTIENAHDDGKAMTSTQTEESRTNHIYSYWYYQPSSDPEERRKVLQVSEREIEIARLEYTIKMLENDLKNINSTRDIDEMRQELAECKADLRSLRWKQRLGW